MNKENCALKLVDEIIPKCIFNPCNYFFYTKVDVSAVLGFCAVCVVAATDVSVPYSSYPPIRTKVLSTSSGNLRLTTRNHSHIPENTGVLCKRKFHYRIHNSLPLFPEPD